MIDIPEEKRRLIYKVGAHGSWWGSVALLVTQISLGGAKPIGKAPPWLGLLIVVMIGTGIAFGMALSRMRLAKTITGVFEVGMRAATALQVNAYAPAAVVEVNFDGEIEQVEHAEVIGWHRDQLIGKPLDTLIPDRYLRRHHESFKRFQTSGETRVSGRTMNVPVLSSAGEEGNFRLTVARVGAVFVGTLAPAQEITDEGEGDEWAL